MAVTVQERRESYAQSTKSFRSPCLPICLLRRSHQSGCVWEIDFDIRVYCAHVPAWYVQNAAARLGGLADCISCTIHRNMDMLSITAIFTTELKPICVSKLPSLVPHSTLRYHCDTFISAELSTGLVVARRPCSGDQGALLSVLQERSPARMSLEGVG